MSYEKVIPIGRIDSTGVAPTYDDGLDNTSTNAVQNKVVTAEFAKVQEEKLDKAIEREMVYGTDKFANQTTIQYNEDALGGGLAKRKSNGSLAVADGVNDDEAINSKQFKDSFLTIKEADALSIVTQEDFFNFFYNLRKSSKRKYQFETSTAPNIIEAVGGLPKDVPADTSGFIYVEIPFSEAGGFVIKVTFEGRFTNYYYEKLFFSTLNTQWKQVDWYAVGLTANNLANLIKTDNTMVADVSEDGNKVEMHLDNSYKSTLATIEMLQAVNDPIPLAEGTDLLTFDWKSFKHGTWFRGTGLLGMPTSITTQTACMIQLIKYKDDRFAIELYHTGLYESNTGKFINYFYADKFKGWERFVTENDVKAMIAEALKK